MAIIQRATSPGIMVREQLPYHVAGFLLSAMLFLVGCAAAPNTRIDNIPMYGQPAIERPDFSKRPMRILLSKPLPVLVVARQRVKHGMPRRKNTCGKITWTMP